jgi:TRAP-type C4-dicarboxylate transport system substrate-binding protein
MMFPRAVGANPTPIAFAEVYLALQQGTAECVTGQIRQSEAELADWFREQGNDVNEVDITPFRDAVMDMHNGDMATWDQETYDRLQAIGADS